MTPERAEETGVSTSGDDELTSSLDRSYVDIIPSSDEFEGGIPVLWGRFWGSDDVASSAFFLEANPKVALEDDQPPVNSLHLAVFGDQANIRDYDPSIDMNQFRNKVVGFNISDVTIPELTLREQRRELEQQLTSSKVNWLRKFLEKEDFNQLERWIEQWFEDTFPESQLEYQVRGTLVEETLVSEEEDVQEASEELDQPDLQERDHDLNETGDSSDDDVNMIDVSVVTSPTNGIQVSKLQVGLEILVRIIGDAVRFLPDDLVDESRSSPSSVPIVTTITDILERPSLPEVYEADPRKYRKIVVELENDIRGEGIVHRDELVKKPGMDQTEDTSKNDDLLYVALALMVLAGLLFVVILL